MQYAKAFLAAAVALVGGIAVGFADDTLTKGEFWAAAAAALVALGGVFQIPNAEPDEDLDRGEEGITDLGLLVVAVVVILLVVLIFGR